MIFYVKNLEKYFTWENIISRKSFKILTNFSSTSFQQTYCSWVCVTEFVLKLEKTLRVDLANTFQKIDGTNYNISLFLLLFLKDTATYLRWHFLLLSHLSGWTVQWSASLPINTSIPMNFLYFTMYIHIYGVMSFLWISRLTQENAVFLSWN